jgi:hypothetical protein
VADEAARTGRVYIRVLAWCWVSRSGPFAIFALSPTNTINTAAPNVYHEPCIHYLYKYAIDMQSINQSGPWQIDWFQILSLLRLIDWLLTTNQSINLDWVCLIVSKSVRVYVRVYTSMDLTPEQRVYIPASPPVHSSSRDINSSIVTSYLDPLHVLWQYLNRFAKGLYLFIAD